MAEPGAAKQEGQPIRVVPKPTENLFEKPSVFRQQGERYEEIQRRITTVRNFAGEKNLAVREDLNRDPHFWLVVTQRIGPLENMLDGIPDKELRRQTAVSIAINEAEVIIANTKEAVVDGLTGAWGRKSLDTYVAQLVERKRKGSVTGLMMLDVDNFKTYNDRYGHAAGDLVLKKVVAEAKGSVRPEDMVARYGGEEFVVVLPGIPTDGNPESVATARAELVRERIEQNAGVTVSVGITTITDGDTSIEDVYKRADNSMYMAKKEYGKNCVVDDTGKKVEDIAVDTNGNVTHAVYSDIKVHPSDQSDGK